MKVRIIKASGPEYWYKNQIGKIFEVENTAEYLQIWHYLKPTNTFDYRLKAIRNSDFEEVGKYNRNGANN